MDDDTLELDVFMPSLTDDDVTWLATVAAHHLSARCRLLAGWIAEIVFEEARRRGDTTGQIEGGSPVMRPAVWPRHELAKAMILASIQLETSETPGLIKFWQEVQKALIIVACSLLAPDLDESEAVVENLE